jgi:diguanylate cyclase
MTAGLDHRRTLTFAAAALSKIVELQLPADPQSFELWYRYATGQNRKLNRDIDETLAHDGKISAAEAQRIHALHIASECSALSAVASKLTDEVGQVVGAINTAVSSAKSYDEKLHDTVATVASVEHKSDLTPTVEELIKATEDMARENCALKEQLELSKSRSEELSNEIERIRMESLADPVTQIGNRQYFDEALGKAIAKANENAAPLTLLFVDIDHFKRINDRFGHQVGDDVLRLVASKLKGGVRDGEVARYGGEEFGIILYNKSREIGGVIAERIREVVEMVAMKDRSSGIPLGRVTVSIGVAELNRQSSSTDLIRRADAALYAAKRKGRNCVVLEEMAQDS